MLLSSLAGPSPVQRLLAAAPVALALVDRDMRYVVVNEAMAEIHALSVAAMAGRRVADFQPEAAGLGAICYALLDMGMPVPDHELEWRGRLYQISAQPVRDGRRRINGLSVAALDITRRKAVEQRLRASRRRLAAHALHDYLTGLLNRRGLELQLHRELRRARREQAPLSVLMADIDWFKAYNDGHGHLAGDECLRAVSAALLRCLRRPGDTAGRYGGEEFVAILPNVDAGGVAVVAENVRARVEALRLDHPSSPFGQVTISVGMASIDPRIHTWPIEHQRAVILEAADQALYEAKAAGRNRTERGPRASLRADIP